MSRRRWDNIPSELRDLPQWVCSAADGQPKNPRTGGNASSSKRATWGTFDEALEGCQRFDHEHVAFALTAEDPFCIVDLDDKADKPADTATRALFDHIVEGLDSYTERSRSGRGLHIVVEATLAKPLKSAHVEIYDRAHFMTFTGAVEGKRRPIREATERVEKIAASFATPDRLPTAPSSAPPAREDVEVVDHATEHPTAGAKFSALHDGDWQQHYASQSEADLAYVGMLWNASGDLEQVERLWLASPLADREKGQRPDYIAGMLAKVSRSPPTLYDDESPASLFSDTANAKRIQHHMGDTLRAVPGIGWHVWDGTRWRLDPWEARRHAGKLGRVIAREAGDILRREQLSDRDRELAQKLMKHAGQSENVSKMEAAMKAAEPLLRCDADQMDADPMLLGCANGVVDLRSGDLLPPDPASFISKSTSVAFDAKAKCPTFGAFLKRIFRKHPDLPAFMQRLAGYWLTGLTDPALLAVLYGAGANGKSTLVGALQSAMGEYAAPAPPGLLIAQYGTRHPTELAALRGRRFVAAAESNEGGRLDEEKVKSLTGSDQISARHMREDLFTFRPTHKLAMMTNHKPMVRGTDEGIWRRLLLVPFDEVIPESERDTSLAQKLRDEAPGILAWAVQGALLFQQEGLSTPPVVASATDSYRSENDVIGAFLDECCERGARYSVEASALYARYRMWADESGERDVSKKKLGMALKERGHASVAVGRNKLSTWQGIRLVGESFGGKALAGRK